MFFTLPIRRWLLIVCLSTCPVLLHGEESIEALRAKAEQGETGAVEKLEKLQWRKEEFLQKRADMGGAIWKIEKEAIDEIQKQIEQMGAGAEIDSSSCEERYEKLRSNINAMEGHTGVVMKYALVGIKEVYELGQQYAKAANEVTQAEKHDLQHLHQSRKSLIQCKFLIQKMNHIFSNYGKFYESLIPIKLEIKPFTEFNQNIYTATRLGAINGFTKACSPNTILLYKIEERIWNLKIAEVELFINKFNEWRISDDGSTVLNNQSDIDELIIIHKKLKKCSDQIVNLQKKILAEKKYRYKNQDRFDNSKSNSSAKANPTDQLDKEVKEMSIYATEKMRTLSFIAMDLLRHIEIAKLRPEAANLIEAKRHIKFAENSKKETQEADEAFKNLGDLVKKSDIDRHWIYLQAVDRYKKLCEKTMNLRMLSITSQDWTSAEGNEAREKLKSDCDSLRNLTWKEHIETRRKLYVACQLLEEFNNDDSVENRRKLAAACEAITEGCLAVVKSGFFIPKEYQIAD